MLPYLWTPEYMKERNLSVIHDYDGTYTIFRNRRKRLETGRSCLSLTLWGKCSEEPQEIIAKQMKSELRNGNRAGKCGERYPVETSETDEPGQELEKEAGGGAVEGS